MPVTIQVLPEYLTREAVEAARDATTADVLVAGVVVCHGKNRRIFGTIFHRESYSWKEECYWKYNRCGVNEPNPTQEACLIEYMGVSIGVLCCLDGGCSALIRRSYGLMRSKKRIFAIPAHYSAIGFKGSDPELRDAAIIFCNGHPTGEPSFVDLRGLSGEFDISKDSITVSID